MRCITSSGCVIIPPITPWGVAPNSSYRDSAKCELCRKKGMIIQIDSINQNILTIAMSDPKKRVCLCDFLIPLKIKNAPKNIVVSATFSLAKRERIKNIKLVLYRRLTAKYVIKRRNIVDTV